MSKEPKLEISLGKYDQVNNNPKIILGNQNKWELNNVGEPETTQYVDVSKLKVSDNIDEDLDDQILQLEQLLKE